MSEARTKWQSPGTWQGALLTSLRLLLRQANLAALRSALIACAEFIAKGFGPGASLSESTVTFNEVIEARACMPLVWDLYQKHKNYT